MLILTRKFGQSLLVGTDIKVKIVGMNKYGVEVGIDAPKQLIIQREEKAVQGKGVSNEVSFIQQERG